MNLRWSHSVARVDWEELSEKLGFKRMTTAMAIFENQGRALEQGLLIEPRTVPRTELSDAVFFYT